MTQNTTAAPDLRPQLFEALEWYASLVAGTAQDQLKSPTPCDGFDVRTLMAHMSTVIEKLEAFATLHRDPVAAHDRGPDRMGALLEERATKVVDDATDRQRHVREGIGHARTAWADDAILDTDIHLGWGPVLPGHVVTGIYLMEVLSHGWDLATATGQSVEAPEPVAAAGLAAARAALPEQGREGFPFGPVVTPAADAGPTEQLANWTGRISR